MIFRKRYRYRFGDIDHAGIAYYPTLLHYFHCAMEDWWAEGIGVRYPDLMRDERYGLPAVRLEVEFFRPVRYGDEPEICIGVLAIGRTSLELGFWMEIDGAVACRARIKTAGVDMDTLKPIPVPARWRSELARWALPESDFPSR